MCAQVSLIRAKGLYYITKNMTLRHFHLACQLQSQWIGKTKLICDYCLFIKTIKGLISQSLFLCSLNNRFFSFRAIAVWLAEIHTCYELLHQ